MQVIAVGPGKKKEDGEISKPNVTVGQTVMYSKYSGTEFEVRAAPSWQRGRIGAAE
jgi:co-chaperonin GroES (HSP10)